MFKNFIRVFSIQSNEISQSTNEESILLQKKKFETL